MRVFLSHSSSDAGFCSSLVRALRDAGADVWYDDQNLGAGNLLEAILREIKDRDVFIVVLSPTALSSPWVRDECLWAYNCHRRDRRRLILPVVAESIGENWLEDWLFLETFKRVEKPGGLAYPSGEAISQTLRILNPRFTDKPPQLLQDEDNADAEEFIAKGQALAAQGQHERAVAFFAQAAQVDPEDSGAWQLLGDEHFFLAGAWSVGSLSELMPKLAGDQTEIVSRHPRAQTLEWALDAYTRALALDPASEYVWFQKGRVLAALGREKEALAAFESAAAIEPNDMLSLILCGRGEALLALDRFEEALAAYNHALTLDPDDGVAREGKATVLEAMAYQARQRDDSVHKRESGA